MAMEICRTCLAVDVTLYSMFDTKGPSQTDGFVADMLGQITKAPPEPSDEISSKVCVSCITEIDRCFNFKTKCDTSERMLRNVLIASRRCNSQVAAAPTIKSEVIDLADDSDDCESEPIKSPLMKPESVAVDSDNDCEIVEEDSDIGSYYIITSIEEGTESPKKPEVHGQQLNYSPEKPGEVSVEPQNSRTTSGQKSDNPRSDSSVDEPVAKSLEHKKSKQPSEQKTLEQVLVSSVNKPEVSETKMTAGGNKSKTTQSIPATNGKNAPRPKEVPVLPTERTEKVETITTAMLPETQPKPTESADKAHHDQREQAQTFKKAKQNHIQPKSLEKPDTAHPIQRDKSQKLICPYCKAMHSGLSIKSHIIAHHIALGEPFSCPLCGKKLDDKVQHDTHISCHKTQKTFDCKHCFRSYLSISELEYHVLIRHGHINSSTGPTDGLPTMIKPTVEKRVQGIPTRRKTSPTEQGTTYTARDTESNEVNIDLTSSPGEASKKLANQREQSPPKTASPESNAPSHDSFKIFSCKQCFDVFFSRDEIESHILSGDCESPATSKPLLAHKNAKRVVEASGEQGASHAKKPKKAPQERPSAESPDSNAPAVVYNISLHSQPPESVAVSNVEKTPPPKASPVQSEKPANTSNASEIFSCKHCVRAYSSQKDLNAHIRIQHPKSPASEPIARLLPNTPGYYLTQPIPATDQRIYANYERTAHEIQRMAPQDSPGQGALLSNECNSFQDTIGAQGLTSTRQDLSANTSVPRMEIPINAVPPLNYSNLRVNSVHYLSRQPNGNTTELVQRQIAPPTNPSVYPIESNSGKEYKCKNCLRVFESQQLAELHAKLNWCLRVKDFARMQTHWEDEQPQTCSFCNITFATKEAISKHLCSSLCDTNFLCKFCGLRFGLLNNLIEHTSRNHAMQLEILRSQQQQ